MWLRLIVTCTCLFIATPSFARGADQHVLGTVMAIDARHVEVKTPKGPVDVQVDKKTRYKDQSHSKGANMPKVGDRVIIKATKGEKKSAKKGDPLLLATEIHFSSGTRTPVAMQPVSAQ